MRPTAERYQALFTETEGTPIAAEKGVSGYRIKTIKAGNTLEVEGYAIWDNRKQGTTARKETEKHREQVAAINRRNSQKKLRRLINTNFGAGDILLTLTYDLYEQPQSDEEAQRMVRNFLIRLRNKRRKFNLPDLKYVYTTEVTHGALGTRYHHHLIVNGGIERAVVETLWTAGLVNSRIARPDAYGLSGWAHYMSKHKETQEKACRHGWTCSRNLRQPRVTVSDHKLSRRRVRQIAEDLNKNGRAILEAVYTGYTLSELPEIKYSPYVDGVYLSARMHLQGGV